MPSIGDSGGGGGQGGHWSGEQDAPRSVLLSAAHSMTGGGLKTEPPTEGEDYSPADGPEKEPPTEQEIAVQEKGRPAAPKVKEEKGQKDDEKPDASSWGNSGKWGEKSTTGSRALGGSLWKGTWDPDRRSNDKGPPAGKRNCSSPSWDVPPDWDPQKEYDALPASQRAILENNFIGLSDGKKYYGLEKGWLYCELCRKKTCISFDFMSVHLQSEKHQRNVRWMQMQSDESRMKAIEDSPSKEELSAALVPATHSGGGNAHVIKQEDLPKFIELRPDCFYCTLCDARPQAWASLEGHIAGQRHRSRYERAEWEQSGQAVSWYGQIAAASSASAASTTAPALTWTYSSSSSTSASSSSVWQCSQPWQPQPRLAPERPLFAPNGRLLPPGFRTARARAKAEAAKAAGPPSRDSFEADGVLL